MKVIDGYDTPITDSGVVLTVGIFDGIHLGHQTVFEEILRWGKTRQLPTAVMTFDPSPTEFLQPNHAPPRLTQLSQKIDILRSFSLDAVFVLKFDARLASTSPEDFILLILVQQLKVRHLVIGYDWHFGQNRSGNPEMLQAYGRKYGFGVTVVEPQQVDGISVHSTQIRSTIVEGNLDLVRTMLGRPYTVRGSVVRGSQHGQSLGFPTANIDAGRQMLPPNGVYAVWAILNSPSGCGTTTYFGVANIGIRPTFGGDKRQTEVHLLNFNQDIYGQELDLIFCQKIREEHKFPDLATLANQIRRDIVVARSALKLS